MSSMTAKELAAKYGLNDASKSQSLIDYTRDVWKRRGFVQELASARGDSQYAGSNLGQFWHILTPILNVAVYFLIFGVLLGARAGVDNYIAFLVTGVLIFSYTQRLVMVGANSIIGKISLVRALHFPRAVLPLAIVIEEFRGLGISLAILMAMALATGEPLTLHWLALIPAVVLLVMFSAGCAFIVARFNAKVPDFVQLLPFIMRTWLYMSGVMFSIHEYTKGKPEWIRDALLANPMASFIDLFRDALLNTHLAFEYSWALATLWAFGTLAVGYVYFYRGEREYGRG